MSDDEKIYEAIWHSPLEDYDNANKPKPNPPPRNGSLRTNISENEDEQSGGYISFEGESVDNLDISVFKTPQNDTIKKAIDSRPLKPKLMPFPKKPCFSELDDNDKLEFHGPIFQIVQKLTASKKSRYAVLISNRLILFEKPEHKVSKIQIPLTSMTGIFWIDNVNYSNKNDCNKFKLDTPARSYKFQCSSHDNAGQWINHIAKLIYDKQNVDDASQPFILKASVSLENVKGKRIFIVEPKFTVAYYESEEDYKFGIAMHRIQLRSSGLKRDRVDNNSFTLVTSYREYKLTFETSSICSDWYETLSIIIQNAIASIVCSKDAKSGEVILNEICQNNSNKCCADCKSSDIQWASVNLFVTLCTKCSGIHRGLSKNVSKIQGIYTDEAQWEDKNLIMLFQVIGNKNANNFWMANYPDDKIEVDDKFINDKYVKKKYMEKRELIFEKYKDTKLLNEELLNCMKSDDVIRTMKLFHIGADFNYTSPLNKMDALAHAEKYSQHLQLTFIKKQCKIKVQDWRDDLIDIYDSLKKNETRFQKRFFFCSINQDTKEERLILIQNDYIQILENENKEICKIYFSNICLVREKKIESDQISLIVVVRETEYSFKISNSDMSINIIEFYGVEGDQSNDLGDFKNVIGQNIYPNFIPSSSYDCIAWVILSTISEEWKPFLLFLNYNSIAEFYDPKEINRQYLSLDLRKIQKIEELKDKNYENICPFKMYNMASICLMSTIIYHIRGDTKESYEEIYKAIQQSWISRDSNSLSNQFLTQNNVPLPIFKMIRYLQIHGTQIEGLFRRVGGVKEAEKIYNELIINPNSYVLANCEPHDVASALKLFFRKLNDPLLTKQLYENWKYAADLQNSEEKLSYYKMIVKALPIINYETLRLLIFLLVNIDKNSDITQMNPDNLGTSFGNCLLTCSQDEGFLPQNLLILPYLIRNYQDLFDVTQEELELEKMYVKERKKINEFSPIETSLLRQIYICQELEIYLKKDVNFERESGNKKSKQLLSKQLRIEQSMTSISLFKKIFNDDVNLRNITFFEDRQIDDLNMNHLIYPQQNLIEVIQNSEQTDSKNTYKKWICKLNEYDLGEKSNSLSFKCWVSLSVSNKNKVYLELSETHQINIWKNDQTIELLINIPMKGMILFRSCEADKFIVAFEDRKNQVNSLPNFLNLFSFKNRSSFNFINFYSKSDYVEFLQLYDRSKLNEFTPKGNQVTLPIVFK